MNGWLNIYKPKGLSSAKIVSIVKRSFPKCKIGHAGTLDVEAEGVLPLAIGEATKLISLLVDAHKEYLFTVKFGVRTDTADSSGKVIDTTDKIPTEDECRQILDKFTGTIEQTPPAYSAIKIDGVRAYKLARQNIEVVINSRKVTIYAIFLEGFNSDKSEATFRVECSKGTYVRTLAEDISLSLQSLGFVVELRRTKVGKFTLNNSVDISQFVHGDWQEASVLLNKSCLKLEEVLDDIPVLNVDEAMSYKIRCGQKIQLEFNDANFVYITCNEVPIAIGSLHNKSFKCGRVLNI